MQKYIVYKNFLVIVLHYFYMLLGNRQDSVFHKFFLKVCNLLMNYISKKHIN